jgi:hypothetical protein
VQPCIITARQSGEKFSGAKELKASLQSTAGETILNEGKGGPAADFDTVAWRAAE